MASRPHPIPQAEIGQTIRYQSGRKIRSGKVLDVATGQGWPCYLVEAKPFPEWIGHEHIKESAK